MEMAWAYYVTMRQGTQTTYLLGPFEEHEQALALVEVAHQEACRLDGLAWLGGFGTARLEQHQPDLPTGSLNYLLEKTDAPQEAPDTP